MYVHYDETTLRLTGITTFAPTGTEFTAPTLDILDVIVDKPLNEYTVSLTDNKINWVGKSDEIIASDLVTAKLLQKDVIRKGFNETSIEDVIVNDISWFGGIDSATKLDSAMRLSELGGLTEVTFFDTANEPHIVTLEDAKTIILTLGIKYQTDFAKKQNLFASIENATLKEDVLNIIW